MKGLLIFLISILSLPAMPYSGYLVGAIGVPGANVLSLPLTIRPFTTDTINNLVEISMVTKHELTHVIQQREKELNLVIEETKNGSGNESFVNLLNLLFKDGIKVDVTLLSNYILQESLLKNSPKLFNSAKNYGLSKSDVESVRNTLNSLKDQLVRCEQVRTCSLSQLTKLKTEIATSTKDIESKMAQMNMQFLALQEATQMESRKFQTLSNASKTRHDVAMNAIRNMK